MFKSLGAAVSDAQARGISLSGLGRALHVMKGAVDRGLVGDLKSASGLVGGDAAKLAHGPPGPLAGTLFRDVLARALAVQEVNWAMGARSVSSATRSGAWSSCPLSFAMRQARRSPSPRSRWRSPGLCSRFRPTK